MLKQGLPPRASKKTSKPLAGYTVILVEPFTVEDGQATKDCPAREEANLQLSAIARLRANKVFEKVIDGDPKHGAVVQLKDCENPVFEQHSADAPSVAARPHSKLARYVRMQVLSFKSDVVRGNIVYGLFDLTRMAIRARRNHAQRVPREALSYAGVVSQEYSR